VSVGQGEAGKRRAWAIGLLSGALGVIVPGSLGWAAPPSEAVAAAGANGRPNVIMVIADDLRTSDVQHMPKTNRLLADKGTTFPNFTTTVPACCPSRVSFLRGQYAHNHKVGYGYPAREESFREYGLDRSTVATWARDAGYRTGYVGKYLNSYLVRRVPPGWDRWYANFRPREWSRTLNVNGVPVTKGGNPDVLLGRIGERFVRNASGDRPFLLLQNFNAPHTMHNQPPPAPEEDLEAFEGVKAPRTPAFNRVRSGMPPHILKRPPLSRQEIHQIDVHHRARLASLQVVDRAVKELIVALRERDELQQTYVFFTSDNGYHMGERRLNEGKMTPLLTDVRVPLLVRGPGVEKGAVREELVQNTDFAPTVAEIADAPTPDFVDGRSIVPVLEGENVAWRTATYFEGRPFKGQHPIHRFTGLTTSDGYHYIEYPEDYFRELYDLDEDPHQMRNLAGDVGQAEIVSELSQRLERLRDCAGEECRMAEDGP
jgi:N-acetylglucosamine-6-sulfatase